jgi:hypothetical protein
MRTLKLAVPAMIVMAGFLLCTTSSYGTPAYLKKETTLKSCNACHAKAATKDNPNLNDLGTCYQKNEHSLAKCTVPDSVKK